MQFLRKIIGTVRNMISSKSSQLSQPIRTTFVSGMVDSIRSNTELIREDTVFFRKLIQEFKKTKPGKNLILAGQLGLFLGAVGSSMYIFYRRNQTQQVIFVDHKAVLAGGERLDFRVNSECPSLDISFWSQAPICVFPWVLPVNLAETFPRDFLPDSPIFQSHFNFKDRALRIGAIPGMDPIPSLLNLEDYRKDIQAQIAFLEKTAYMGKPIKSLNETWDWSPDSRKKWVDADILEDKPYMINGLTLVNTSLEPVTLRFSLGCTGHNCSVRTHITKSPYIRYLLDL